MLYYNMLLLILKKNIDELLKQNLSRDKEKIVPEEVISLRDQLSK